MPESICDWKPCELLTSMQRYEVSTTIYETNICNKNCGGNCEYKRAYGQAMEALDSIKSKADTLKTVVRGNSDSRSPKL